MPGSTHMLCRKHIALLFASAAVLAFGCCACATISAKEEVEIGRAYAAALAVEPGLSRDAAAQSRVERIGSRIVSCFDSTAYPYQFQVLAVSDVNAQAAPGGFILINQGLVSKLPRDDSLAFVIAHEIAHAAHRHYAQRLAKMERVVLLSVMASTAIGDEQLQFAVKISEMLNASYSRDNERGADAAALGYMRKAGYSTDGALDAMRVLIELDKGPDAPTYLRTHPSPAHRLELLQACIQDLDREDQERPTPMESSASEIDLSTLVGELPSVHLAANPYFPLAVGNEWHYCVDAGGAAIAYSLRIAGAVSISVGTIYRAEMDMGEAGVSPRQLLTTETQLWQRYRPEAADSHWAVECILTDTGAEDVEQDGGWIFTVVGKEDITLPCGQFAAVLHITKRRKDNSGSAFDIWYAQGVGMVKRVDEKTGYTETLQSYKLNAEPVMNAAEARESGTSVAY